MPADVIIEPIGVLEVYVDGFTEHIVRDGVMTCVGYRRMPDGRKVVLRLAWPAVNTAEAVESAITAAAMPTAAPQNGSKRGVH